MSETTKKEMLSGMKWVATGRLFTQLITWGMTFFVLRLLAPADYGLVALSTAFTALFGLIAEFGFAAANGHLAVLCEATEDKDDGDWKTMITMM